MSLFGCAKRHMFGVGLLATSEGIVTPRQRPLHCGISICPLTAMGQSRRIRTFATLLACPLCLQ